MKSTEEDDDVVGRERVGLKKKTEIVVGAEEKERWWKNK